MKVLVVKRKFKYEYHLEPDTDDGHLSFDGFVKQLHAIIPMALSRVREELNASLFADHR